MKSFCEFLLQRSPKVFKYADFRLTYIAICVFSNILSYTTVMLNIVTIPSPSVEENVVYAKDFKNIAPESCCF